MTSIDIYRPPEVAVPDHRDTDSWVAVVSEVIKVANVIYDTPFVPEGLRGSAPAVAAAILAGREMGIGPMTSLQHIHVIKGRPAQSALLMRALIQSAGHKWEDGDVTDTRAIVRGCRKGESSWAEVTFTADQARKAGIDLGKYPADKLYARATSRLARRKFADVIAGMPYSPEDLEDSDGAEVGTVTETAATAIGNGAEKPRTAQRKQRPQNASPAPPAPPPDAGQTPVPPVPAERAGEALPPLPGEEEDAPGPVSGTVGAVEQAGPGAPDDSDYDVPGTVTEPMLRAIWTVLGKVYGFTDKEKDTARAVCAHIVGHELETSSNLSYNEAKAVLDTLGNWQAVAHKNKVEPRKFLDTILKDAGVS